MKVPKYAHNLKVEQTLDMLQTYANGLKNSEVIKRQREFGQNLIKEQKNRTNSRNISEIPQSPSCGCIVAVAQ